MKTFNINIDYTESFAVKAKTEKDAIKKAQEIYLNSDDEIKHFLGQDAEFSIN